MKRISPFIPYFAVALGMYGLGSAWCALGLYHAGMLSAVVLSRREKSVESKRAVQSRWIPPLMAVFGLGGVAVYVLWPHLWPDKMIVERLGRFGVTPHTWPYLAVYFSVVNSVVEELFWRGYLGSRSSRLVINDLLFAGYHAFVMLAFAGPLWAVPVFVACAFAGWLWRMLRTATGSLVVPIITHVIADASIVVAVRLRAFG